VQNRQHRAVLDRIEKLVRVPAARQGTSLCLTVADRARDDQSGIVERRTERVRERVAELAALVDRARDLRRAMARNAARERELLEQALHSGSVLPDLRIHLGVAALEPGVRGERGTAVAGPDDEQHVE